MLYLVIDDCTVEVEVVMKGSGMSIHSYKVNIVGFEEFEILGQREFGAMVKLIEAQIQEAIAKIDSCTSVGWED